MASERHETAGGDEQALIQVNAPALGVARLPVEATGRLTMKAVMAALTVFSLQMATPAIAQADRAQAAAKAPAPAMASHQPTHEMCKAVMGKRMDPKAVHDHGRDKTGAATWPNGKPPSKAEMARLHKACGELMHGTTPGAPHAMPKS